MGELPLKDTAAFFLQPMGHPTTLEGIRDQSHTHPLKTLGSSPLLGCLPVILDIAMTSHKYVFHQQHAI